PRRRGRVERCRGGYTNHAEADQNDMDTLLTLLAAAGVPFVITVPGADDVMLGYQSLSFHDVLVTRRTMGLRPAPEFEAWLRTVGMVDDTGKLTPFDLERSALRSLTSAEP
ncbi:ethanolamine ammonia-lyase subunit EutB, partial [Mycobacterium sp. NPDC003449]